MKDLLAILGMGLSAGWLAGTESVGILAYHGPALQRPEWVSVVHQSQVLAGLVFLVSGVYALYVASQ